MKEAERQELIKKFASELVSKETEVSELRQRYASLGSYREPDPADDADRLREQTETAALIYNMERNEMPRVRRVIDDLRRGWNGECASGCGELVVERLKRGYATHHCCACKTHLEEKVARNGEKSVAGVYRSKLAYG